MRILYLTDTRQVGGAERYLVDLAEGMHQNGHEVALAAPQEEMVEFAAREAPGIRVLRALGDAHHDAAGLTGRACTLAPQFGAMVRLIRRVGPDLLHVNNGGWPGSDLLRLAPLAGRLAGVRRRLITVHSNPWPRSGPEQPVADALVWRNVDAVICPSRAVLDGLAQRRGMPGSLGRVMYYGVREPGGAAEAAALRATLAAEDDLLVGMVSARPVPEKGYGAFLEAMEAARPGTRGVLVGRYPGGFEEAVAESEVDGRLELPGVRRDVGAFYHAFDVLTVPSTAEECMPLVILEAAAAGTPTFGSRLSGIPEAIEEGRTGRTFPPGDAAALAGLIDEALDDRKAVAEMGRHARERWEAMFSLDLMLAEHERLYSGRTATQE
jgi:glycosyltransferase involved in cell wall biosynthesis